MLGEPALPASDGVICLDSNGATERLDYTAYSLSDIINTSDKTVPYSFECIVAGSTVPGEAAFIAVTAAGQTVVDGTATFISRDPTIWNYPMITAGRAMAAYKDRLPSIKEIWADKDHLEGAANTNNITTVNNFFDEIPAIYRMDKNTNEYSPTTKDGSSNNNYTAGTGGDISMGADSYWYGFRFECEDAFQVHAFNFRFEDCKIEYAVQNWDASLVLRPYDCEFVNTEIVGDSRGVVGQIMSFYQGPGMKVKFLGCSFQMINNTTGYLQGANVISEQVIEFESCDFSNLTNPALIDSSDFSLGSDTNADVTILELMFDNCLLPSSYTIWDGTWVADIATQITVENCSDNGTDTYVNEYRDLAGGLKYDDAAYYDSGYEEDESSTRLSIVLSPESKVSQSLSVSSSQIGGFFATRGIKTLTLELVENFTSPLNASEIWLELYYYKDNNDALRTLDKSTKEYIKATFTELPAGAGLGNWTGEPAGSRSVKLTTTLSVNHPGLFYGVVRLAKYESGKVVHIDPEFQIS